MSSYVNRKERVFCPTFDKTVCPPCSLDTTYMRAQARLKSYLSCLDTRAWHLDDDKRRQHFLDSIKIRECFPLGQLVPVSVLVKTCPHGSKPGQSSQSMIEPKSSVSVDKSTIGSASLVEIGTTIGSSKASSTYSLTGSAQSSFQNENSQPRIAKSHEEFLSHSSRAQTAPESQTSSQATPKSNGDDQHEDFKTFLEAIKSQKTSICTPGDECWRKSKTNSFSKELPTVNESVEDVNKNIPLSNVIEPIDDELKHAKEEVQKSATKIQEMEMQSIDSNKKIEELQAENLSLRQELDKYKAICNCYEIAKAENVSLRNERDDLREKLDEIQSKDSKVDTEYIMNSKFPEPAIEIHWRRKDQMHEDDENDIFEDETEIGSDECRCNNCKDYRDLQVHAEIMEKELEYIKEALATERENNAQITALLEQKNAEVSNIDPMKMEVERELRNLRHAKCERDILKLKIEKYAGLEEELCRLRYRAHEANAMSEKLDRHANQIEYFCQMECELAAIKNRLDEYNVVPERGESFADVFEQMISQRNCLEYLSKDLEVKVTTLSGEMVDLVQENKILQRKSSEMVVKLNEELERKDLEIEQYKARLGNLEGLPEEFAALQQQLIQLVAIIDHLTPPAAEIEQIECQIHCIVARLRKCNDQFNPSIVDQLMTFIVELQNKNCNILKDTEELKNENSLLLAKNKVLECRTSMMSSRIYSLETQIKFADLKLKKMETSGCLVNDDCLILIRKEIESAQSKLFELGLPEAHQIADSLDMFVKELEFVHENFEKVHQKLMERKRQLDESNAIIDSLTNQLATERFSHGQTIQSIEKIDNQMKYALNRFSNLRPKVENEIQNVSQAFDAIFDENVRLEKIISAVKNDWHFSELYCQMNLAVASVRTFMEKMDDVIREKDRQIDELTQKITELENRNRSSRGSESSEVNSNEFIQEIMEDILENFFDSSSDSSSGVHTPFPTIGSGEHINKALKDMFSNKEVQDKQFLESHHVIQTQYSEVVASSLRDELLSIVYNLQTQIDELKTRKPHKEHQIYVEKVPNTSKSSLFVASSLLEEVVALSISEKESNAMEIDLTQPTITCKDYLEITSLPTVAELTYLKPPKKQTIEIDSIVKPTLIENKSQKELESLKEKAGEEKIEKVQEIDFGNTPLKDLHISMKIEVETASEAKSKIDINNQKNNELPKIQSVSTMKIKSGITTEIYAQEYSEDPSEVPSEFNSKKQSKITAQQDIEVSSLQSNKMPQPMVNGSKKSPEKDDTSLKFSKSRPPSQCSRIITPKEVAAVFVNSHVDNRKPEEIKQKASPSESSEKSKITSHVKSREPSPVPIKKLSDKEIKPMENISPPVKEPPQDVGAKTKDEKTPAQTYPVPIKKMSDKEIKPMENISPPVKKPPQDVSAKTKDEKAPAQIKEKSKTIVKEETKKEGELVLPFIPISNVATSPAKEPQPSKEKLKVINNKNDKDDVAQRPIELEKTPQPSKEKSKVINNKSDKDDVAQRPVQLEKEPQPSQKKVEVKNNKSDKDDGAQRPVELEKEPQPSQKKVEVKNNKSDKDDGAQRPVELEKEPQPSQKKVEVINNKSDKDDGAQRPVELEKEPQPSKEKSKVINNKNDKDDVAQRPVQLEKEPQPSKEKVEVENNKSSKDDVVQRPDELEKEPQPSKEKVEVINNKSSKDDVVQRPVEREPELPQTTDSDFKLLVNQTLLDEIEKLKEEKDNLEKELNEMKKLLEECQQQRVRESQASMHNLTMLKKQYENVSKTLLAKHEESVEKLEQANFEALENQAHDYEQQIITLRKHNEMLEAEIESLKKQIQQTCNLEVTPVISIQIPPGINNQTDVGIQAEINLEPKPCHCKQNLLPSKFTDFKTKNEPLKAISETKPFLKPCFCKRLPVVASPSVTRLMNKVLYEGFENLRLPELHLLNDRIAQFLSKLQGKQLQEEMDVTKFKVQKLLMMENELSKSQKAALERATNLAKTIESQQYAITHLPDFSSFCKVDNSKMIEKAFQTEPCQGYLKPTHDSKYKDCRCYSKGMIPCHGKQCPVDSNVSHAHEKSRNSSGERKLLRKCIKKSKKRI